MLSFAGTYDWSCTVGIDCQDVFDFRLNANALVTIAVTNVTGTSVAQVALYGPSVALGGVNLLTGTTNELRCDITDDCGAYTAGQIVPNVTITQAGRYRLAITRHWGHSCGSGGTYQISVTSATPFQVLGQTVNDGASQAPGYECK